MSGGGALPPMEMPDAYGYEENLMHGRYHSDATDYAKEYAKKLKYRTDEDEETDDPEHNLRHYSGKRFHRVRNSCRKLRFLFANDYVFLLILGILMAFLSFGLDFVIRKFQVCFFT